MSDYDDEGHITVEQAEANLAANPETAKKIEDFLKDPSTGVVYEGRHIKADAVAPDNNDDEDEENEDDDEEDSFDEEDDEDEDDDDEDDAEYERKDIENF